MTETEMKKEQGTLIQIPPKTHAEPSAPPGRTATTLARQEDVRVVLVSLDAEAELKEHKASGSVVIQVLEGEAHFLIDGHRTEMRAGQLLVLQAEVLHSVWAPVDCRLLLTLASKQA